MPAAPVLSAVPDPAPRRLDELESRLIGLIRTSSTLVRALRAARTVDPPVWLIPVKDTQGADVRTQDICLHECPLARLTHG
jgi:hypothetical protein